MIQRPIPSTNEKIPVIGLGTWSRFDVGSSNEERRPVQEVISAAGTVNGMLIDTSPMYARSEEVIGDCTAAAGLSDRFFYATKVWITGREEGVKQMNNSMKKLKRNVIDLMQIHNLLDWETHLKTLVQWKEEGKIRYIGITHYKESAHDELERIIKLHTIDFIQLNLSLRFRYAEQSLLNTAMDRGVAAIINEPFEKGRLFRLAEGKNIPAWCRDAGINSWGEFFLKFIVSHPAVTCVIPATSDLRHLQENINGGTGQLPDAGMREKMAAWIQQL